MDDIRSSMKMIIEQTNNVLKHSAAAFKKVKQKIKTLDDVKMKPNEKTKEWFEQRNISKLTIPEFFDLIFREASEKNNLDFDTKSIVFNEIDAQVFGFTPNTKIPILTLFENIPNYFI